MQAASLKMDEREGVKKKKAWAEESEESKEAAAEEARRKLLTGGERAMAGRTVSKAKVEELIRKLSRRAEEDAAMAELVVELEGGDEEDDFVRGHRASEAVSTAARSSEFAEAVVSGMMRRPDWGDAAKAARIVFKQSMLGAQRLVKGGGVEAFVECLKAGDKTAVREAATSLELATCEYRAEGMSAAALGAARALADAVAAQGGAIGRACVRCLRYVPWTVDDLVRGCVPFLLRLLDYDPEDYEARLSASGALRTISVEETARPVLAAHDAPSVFVKRLRQFETELGDDIATAAANLTLFVGKLLGFRATLKKTKKKKDRGGGDDDDNAMSDAPQPESDPDPTGSTPVRAAASDPEALASEEPSHARQDLVAPTSTRTELVATYFVRPAARLAYLGNRRARHADMERLAACAMTNRVAVASAGGIEALVLGLDAPDSETRKAASRGLLDLAFAGVRSRAALVRHRAIPALVELARQPVDEAAANQAGDALRAFYEGGRDDVASLVDLASGGQPYADGAVLALAVVTANETPRPRDDAEKKIARKGLQDPPPGSGPSNARDVADVGGLEVLANLLTHSKNDNVRHWAAQTLANIGLESDDLRIRILDTPGAIDGLVAILKDRNASDDAKTQAAAALCHVALASDDAKVSIMRADAVQPIIHLAKWGSRAAQEKANVALAILGVETVDDYGSPNLPKADPTKAKHRLANKILDHFDKANRKRFAAAQAPPIPEAEESNTSPDDNQNNENGLGGGDGPTTRRGAPSVEVDDSSSDDAF